MLHVHVRTPSGEPRPQPSSTHRCRGKCTGWAHVRVRVKLSPVRARTYENRPHVRLRNITARRGTVRTWRGLARDSRARNGSVPATQQGVIIPQAARVAEYQRRRRQRFIEDWLRTHLNVVRRYGQNAAISFAIQAWVLMNRREERAMRDLYQGARGGL